MEGREAVCDPGRSRRDWNPGQRWQVPVGLHGTANGVANIPTVVTDGDHVFTSSGYGTGSALLKLCKDGDGVKAEQVYFLDAKTFENHHGGFVLSDGFIYAGAKHNKGFPICVEMKTGEVKWGGDIRRWAMVPQLSRWLMVRSSTATRTERWPWSERHPVVMS